MGWGMPLALSRNSKKVALVLLVSAFVCFLFVQNNSQLEKQIALGNSFFKQLRELKSQNNLSAVKIETEIKSKSNSNAIIEEKKEKESEILQTKKKEELNEEKRLFTGDQEFQVTIWIDLPNAFPWRYCVQEYNNLFAVLNCDKSVADQVFTFGKSLFTSAPLYICVIICCM